MKHLFFEKRSLITTLVIVAVVLSVCIIGTIKPIPDAVLDFKVLVFIPLAVIWLVDLNKKITHRHIRNYIFLTGIFLLFWIIIQFIKFRSIYSSPNLIKYCWYLYYIPMTMIPLLLFYSSLYFGKNDNIKISRKWHLLGIFALFLIVVVLTNDLHQLVFTFTGPDQNVDYYHNVFYYVELGWNIILLAGTLINAIRQATTKAYKRFGFFPFLILVVGGIYLMISYLLPSSNVFLSFSESYWIMIIAFFESLCAIRLIPTNVGYEDYFDKSTIDAVIVDKNLEPVYKTSKVESPEKTYIKNSIESPYFANENTKISSKTIKGGYAIYKEDLTKLNEAKHKMEEYNSALFERNELLRSENELLKKRSTIEVNEQLFSKIFDFVKKEYDIVVSTIENLNPDDSDFAKKIKHLNVIDSYIKRISNLILLREKHQYISLKDIEYSLNETFEYLNLKGIACSFSINNTTSEIESNAAVGIYYSIWSIISPNLDRLDSAFASINVDGINIAVRVGLEGYDLSNDFSIDGYKIEKDDNEDVYTVLLEGVVRHD